MTASRRAGRRIPVRVHLRASVAKVRLQADGTVHVWLHSAPVEGAANRELVEAIAAWAGVPASAVRLVSGARSRDKVVEVIGAHPEREA